ncbi:DUF6913 domain-containing protein [Flavobacterium sp. JP2137]|uniref:DUF6913 domain-containing protein n=1 Tax=Flavobacterium sp. JP2137 TaxID=3414510 RepID=UPI003D300FE1
MFLNILKYKALKKSATQQLFQGQEIDLKGRIKEVGIILNHKDFSNKEALVWELGLRNIQADQIFFLISQADVTALKARETAVKSTDFDNRAHLKNEAVRAFVAKPFDLLISYYDVDDALLLWCTAHSKAKFKVGFSNVKLNSNHLSLQLEIEKFKSYIDELFRYIEILKK